MAKRKKVTSLRNSAYEALKAMIITGQLPPGSRLTEIELAEKLSVSRTPIREALNRLERDGLVVSRIRHGFAVKEFDVNMFREAFAVREALDACATQLACANITSAGRQRLRALVKEGEDLAKRPNRRREHMFKELQVGMDIHRTIAELSGNAMLSDMINGILDKCLHYVWMELLWLDQWQEARTEHSLIVEAICAGDAAQACELTRHHIRGSSANASNLLETRVELQVYLSNAP
jgi:DNA-binding GntR family transcriptional regulator